MITIGHQTIRLFILSCPTFVPKHSDLEGMKNVNRISFHTIPDSFSLWHEKLSGIVRTQPEIGLRVGD